MQYCKEYIVSNMVRYVKVCKELLPKILPKKIGHKPMGFLQSTTQTHKMSCYHPTPSGFTLPLHGNIRHGPESFLRGSI
jgi:hypothetical protein